MWNEMKRHLEQMSNLLGMNGVMYVPVSARMQHYHSSFSAIDGI